METSIKNYIGMAALLEQTAEECAELSQACLKFARKWRGENPTPATIYDLQNNLTEEVADVNVCIGELIKGNVVAMEEVMTIAESKKTRWLTRLENKNNN